MDDTPWSRVVPYDGNDVSLNVDPVVADNVQGGTVFVPWGSADQMLQHRLRGPRPYEPTREVCQSCCGVTKHSRKKTLKGTEFQIHAEFGFPNKDRECVPESEDSERGNVKVLSLVLRESYVVQALVAFLSLVIVRGTTANFRSGCSLVEARDNSLCE